MDRTQILTLWNDMWQEGNWIPSWPDSLAGLTADEAARQPDANCHSIWQEVNHIAFWRNYTLDLIAGRTPPTAEEVERREFAGPDEVTEEAWAAAVAALKQTQDELAAIIPDESNEITRIVYHLVHDPYHLGRITQLRAMRGTPPKF